MKIRIACSMFVLGLSAACATSELSQSGARVQLTPNAPSDGCKNLGMVVGQGGGAFGGAYVANDQLLRYATNDAQNKAAALGATHLQLSPPQFGGASGTTTTATVSGFAYRCGSGEQPTASAAPVAPAATTCHPEDSPAWKSASVSEKKQMLDACVQKTATPAAKPSAAP